MSSDPRDRSPSPPPDDDDDAPARDCSRATPEPRADQSAPEVPYQSKLGTILALLGPLAGAGPGKRPHVVDHWLAFYQSRYDDTQNPAFMWEAIAEALGADRPLPRPVVEYLLRVAVSFQALSRTETPAGNLAASIMRALEFDPVRGRNPFRDVTDVSHDLLIAFDVSSRLRQRSKLDFALVEVAHDHPARCTRDPKCETMSRSTVARIWDAYGSRFTE